MSKVLLGPPIGNTISVAVICDRCAGLESEREVHGPGARTEELDLVRLRLVPHLHGISRDSGIDIGGGGIVGNARITSAAKPQVFPHGSVRTGIEQIEFARAAEQVSKMRLTGGEKIEEIGR